MWRKKKLNHDKDLIICIFLYAQKAHNVIIINTVTSTYSHILSYLDSSMSLFDLSVLTK